MRLRLLSLTLLCATFSLVAAAQNAATKLASCPVQPAQPATDADRALANGDAVHAEELFRQQGGPTPKAADRAGIVHSLLQQNKLTEAVALAKETTAAETGSADAQVLLGEALARAGQVPEASAAFLKAISLDECSARAHFGNGKLNDLVGRHLTAAKEIFAAHTVAPKDPEITAAFLPYVKPELHTAALRGFLASKPLLSAATLQDLSEQLAVNEQHKSCTVVHPFTTAKVALEPIMFSGRTVRSWGLELRVNDLKMPVFELDSSVSGIVLNPADAARAGVHPLGAVPVPKGAPSMAYVDSIRIGELEYRDCPVRVVSADALAGANSLIGTDFFRDHLIKVDYAANLLSLGPLPALPVDARAGFADQFIAPEEQDWSPVYVAGANVLVPTLINKKGPLLFLMDTGIGRSVVSPAVATSELSGSKDQVLNLHGSSGTIVKVIPHDGGANQDVSEVHGSQNEIIPVYSLLKLPVYRFTHNEKPDPNTVAFDLSPLSHAIGTEVAGLLGFDLLHAYLLEINYRDALAHILFDQNRRYDVRQFERGF